jgi:predicted nucleotidyltransferase
VRAAILYGSAARGTATEESDVDLLVLADRRRQPAVLDVVRALERAHDVLISVLVADEEEFLSMDRQFVDSILREGRALVGSMPRVPFQALGLQPYRIVRLYVTHLKPPEKMRLYRRLDGFRTVRRQKRKRYVHESAGFLREVGGWRMGRGTVVVPEPAVARLEEILRGVGAKRWMIPAWIQAS